MTTTRAVDAEAERALLGACLVSDHAVIEASQIVAASDFGAPLHQTIFAAMVNAIESGQRVDPLQIAQTVGDDGALGTLHELQNGTYVLSNAARYAERIVAASLRAKAIQTCDQIMTMAHRDTDPGDIADYARERFSSLDIPTHRGAPDPDVDSFMASVDSTYDWLVPNFLERGDRMLVTATEGAGKSVLLTQIGFQVAAGVHPWTHADVPPANVTVIDLENGRRLINRRLQMLRSKGGDQFDPQRLRVHSRPSGIDLTNRRDHRWLMDRCQANNTDLLVVGPAYRLASGVAAKGDIGAEDQTKRVTAALDDIRNRCGVTLLMETHAPHGGAGYGRDLRPFGSSVWLRWPEFGIGLRKENPDDPNRYAIEHWRGARDERAFPKMLVRGSRWPWMPEGMPTNTFRSAS